MGNPPFQTTVTAIITHTLFGTGRHWNGKLFRNDLTGINQFRKLGGGGNGIINKGGPGREAPLEMAHPFQYQLGTTQLKRSLGDDAGGGTSLKHDYAPYHPFILSPWRSMRDELRWIPCSSGKVMIGIGYFGWSGGVWEFVSVFALYAAFHRLTGILVAMYSTTRTTPVVHIVQWCEIIA